MPSSELTASSGFDLQGKKTWLVAVIGADRVLGLQFSRRKGKAFLPPLRAGGGPGLPTVKEDFAILSLELTVGSGFGF